MRSVDRCTTPGVALANQGDIDRQSIAGAVATGTHGTGRTLRNLSASVRGLRIVTADGNQIVCDAHNDPATFEAARLGLGAFGVVTQIELAVVPAYRLAETGWRTGYDELRPSIESLCEQHRHFELFWYPGRDFAVAKAIDETDEPAVYPVGNEGSRTAWNYEVLPNHRPHLHTEMEFGVPLDRSLDCLDEIRDLLTTQFPELVWPVEYRTLAADDVWLSQAYERRHGDDLRPPGRRRLRRSVVRGLRGRLPSLRRTTALGQGALLHGRRPGRRPPTLDGLVVPSRCRRSRRGVPERRARAAGDPDRYTRHLV